jgi:hypothetical protein
MTRWVIPGEGKASYAALKTDEREARELWS